MLFHHMIIETVCGLSLGSNHFDPVILEGGVGLSFVLLESFQFPFLEFRDSWESLWNGEISGGEQSFSGGQGGGFGGFGGLVGIVALSTLSKTLSVTQKMEEVVWRVGFKPFDKAEAGIGFKLVE